MKKYLRLIFLLFLLALPPTASVKAQFPGIQEVIKQAVKKVVKAVTLKIQRLENKLQGIVNGLKAVENNLSGRELKGIAAWGERQKKLFGKYYEDLKKIRNTIALYKKVRRITESQKLLVDEYKSAFSLFKKDKNFSREEIEHIYAVYSGMFDVSLKNLETLLMISGNGKTEMNDASRLELIDNCADKMEEVLSDLREFTNSNVAISIQRAQSKKDVNTLKSYYGIK